MTTAVQLAQSVAPGVSLGFKNRIMNGNMTIDQRNAGALISGASGYTLDRWYLMRGNISSNPVFNVQQSTTVPAGFKNSALITVATSGAPGTTNYSCFYQKIEGLNTADMNFGSASAVTFTLSFWVNCSVTGTYGVAFQNDATTRSYIATYTVNAANTWEYKTITVAGDTSGTWLTTNGVGLAAYWDIGVGTTQSTTAGSWQAGNYLGLTGGTKLSNTNGATFYITGVQLEVGTAATSFEFRDYGRELIMCQRYYQKSFSQGQAPANNVEASRAINAIGGRMQVADVIGMRSGEISLVCYMRTQPTFVTYNPFSATGVAYYYSQTAATQDSTTAGALSSSECGFALFQYTGVTPGTTGDLLQVIYHYTASAEL